MKAMILAAGRGERMRPLTDSVPKPLLKVGREPLIGWHLRRLSAAGITEVVINHAWLGGQIEALLTDGTAYGVSIVYSSEGKQGLETAGGIATALPLLGEMPFLVVNGDVLTDMDFSAAIVRAEQLRSTGRLAHLWMVPNPAHHPQGDFSLLSDGEVVSEANEGKRMTFSGVGVYDPKLFEHVVSHQPAKLAPLLRDAMARNQVTGEALDGVWLDVGTVARLEEAKKVVQDW